MDRLSFEVFNMARKEKIRQQEEMNRKLEAESEQGKQENQAIREVQVAMQGKKCRISSMIEL